MMAPPAGSNIVFASPTPAHEREDGARVPTGFLWSNGDGRYLSKKELLAMAAADPDLNLQFLTHDNMARPFRVQIRAIVPEQSDEETVNSKETADPKTEAQPQGEDTEAVLVNPKGLGGFSVEVRYRDCFDIEAHELRHTLCELGLDRKMVTSKLRLALDDEDDEKDKSQDATDGKRIKKEDQTDQQETLDVSAELEPLPDPFHPDFSKGTAPRTAFLQDHLKMVWSEAATWMVFSDGSGARRLPCRRKEDGKLVLGASETGSSLDEDEEDRGMSCQPQPESSFVGLWTGLDWNMDVRQMEVVVGGEAGEDGEAAGDRVIVKRDATGPFTVNGGFAFHGNSLLIEEIDDEDSDEESEEEPAEPGNTAKEKDLPETGEKENGSNQSSHSNESNESSSGFIYTLVSGAHIRQFRLEDKQERVTGFVCPMGNSNVPYPVCFSRERFYHFLADHNNDHNNLGRSVSWEHVAKAIHGEDRSPIMSANNLLSTCTGVLNAALGVSQAFREKTREGGPEKKMDVQKPGDRCPGLSPAVAVIISFTSIFSAMYDQFPDKELDILQKAKESDFIEIVSTLVFDHPVFNEVAKGVKWFRYVTRKHRFYSDFRFGTSRHSFGPSIVPSDAPTDILYGLRRPAAAAVASAISSGEKSG